MAVAYVTLQALAAALMASGALFPALLVAGVALLLALRGPLRRWQSQEVRGTRRVPPRPAQIR